MAAITLRSIKGSPLTIQEVDDNFSNLNIEVGQKLNSSAYTTTDILTRLKTVDGIGSGLDADLLDGLNSATLNTPSTIVARDASGNFSAGTITSNLIGNVTGNVQGTVTGSLIGNATNVSGVVAIANGGTGGSSTAQALFNLLPAGAVSGYVLKTTGPGTYYWGAETGATSQAGTKIETTRQFYTATAGQTLFAGVGTYTPGSNQLRVYIDGVRQFNSAYTETSSTSFTLTESVAAGTLVMAEVDGFVVYDFSADEISLAPVGNVSATNVQAAISELDTEKAALNNPSFTNDITVASNVKFSGWKIYESGGNLYFAHNNDVKMSITSTGNLTVTGDIIGFGNP